MDRRHSLVTLVVCIAISATGCTTTGQFSHEIPFLATSNISCGNENCTTEGCCPATTVCNSDGCAEGCVSKKASFVRGQPNVVLDGVGWVAGIPSKILLFNRNVDNHEVSPETENALQEYLVANGLDDVKVRVNQYDPLGEWKRLIQNDSMHAGWRYTVGALVTTRYTVLPGRIVGGDEYNPFTNTISLYSDRASIALREGAHAKITNEARYRGLVSSSMYIPASPLWIDTIATRDVLDYSRTTKQRKLEREVYLVLFPAYGSRIGQSLTLFIDTGESTGVSASLALVGHAVGRTMAAFSSDSPLEVAKSFGGIVRKKKHHEPLPVADDSNHPPLPPVLTYPVRFEPLDVIYHVPADSI